MKAQLAAIAAMALIAVGADLALDRIGFDSAEHLSADLVRLD